MTSKRQKKHTYLHVSYSLRRDVNYTILFFHFTNKKVSNKAMNMSWNITSAFKSSVPGNSSCSSQTSERLGTIVALYLSTSQSALEDGFQDLIFDFQVQQLAA